MSQLEAWFRELRDGGKTEAQALEVIAGRLGEPVIETKRIVSSIAGVKLRGRVQGHGGARRSAPATRPAESVNGNGQRPELAQLNEVAIRDYYRTGRLTLTPDRALRACAKRFGVRPHDVRPIVAAVERGLQDREA